MASIKVACLGSGIDTSLVPHLFVLDQHVPLRQVIKEVCKVWNIDATRALGCALKLEDTGVYVTQDNRNMLSDGSVLVLSKAPEIAAKEQLGKLTKDSEESLKSLRYETKDATFAHTFIQLNGLTELTKVIGVYKADPGERTNLGYALRSYAQLLMHKDAVSEALAGMSARTKFVEDLIPLTREGGVDKGMQKWIIHSVLEIAGILVLHSPTGFEVIDAKLTLEAVVKHIESMTAGTTQPPDIQEAAVKLINCMITACPTKRRQALFGELNRLMVINKLMPRVIKGCEDGAVYAVPASLAHELYVLQTNFVMEEQGDVASAKPTWDRTRVDWLGLITRLGTAKTGSAADTPEKLELLGFPDTSSAQASFNVYPGAVGLECISFLARKYPAIYKDLFEKMADRPVEYRCPFVSAGQSITTLLLKILDVVPGSKPDDKCTAYLPLYFTTPKAFQELFCVAMRVMATTWIDMEAKVIDTEKVLLVVEKQVRSVLDHPEKKIKPDIVEFQNAVMKCKYVNVLQSEQKAMEDDFAAQMASPVVASVKENIRPEMIQLVHKQRLAHMSQGAFFCTVEKGKITTKRFYAVLAPNHKTLHWSAPKDEFQVGNNDMRPSIAQLPPATTGEGMGYAALEDIHMFEIGESVAALRTVRSKPNEDAAKPLTFAILTGQEDWLVFVAGTRETAAIWIEGMRILMRQSGMEPETDAERVQLMDMQMHLKLMDMHGVKLPKVNPVIPKLPPTFAFHYTDTAGGAVA